MFTIEKASVFHQALLSDIGRQTFIESHGSSADKIVIDEYVEKKFSKATIEAELEDENNLFHIIYVDKEPAGYSKIILNAPHVEINKSSITKLERFYLLERFYGRYAGAELMTFNINLSKQNNQAGMWLYVWTENKRAVKFYTRHGFNIIGHFDFKLTDSHSNPNHLMYLEY